MDDSQLRVLAENINSIKPLLYKTLGKPVAMNSDITAGAYYAMLYLKKHDTLSMSDLGKTLQISKPNVTALINKLIAKGLVLRLSDKQDRRIVMVKLSAKGTKFIDKNQENYLNQTIKRLMSLTESELKLFSVSLQNVSDVLAKLQPIELNEI